MDNPLQALMEATQHGKPLEVKKALKALAAENKARFLDSNAPCIDRLKLRTQQIDTLLSTLWQFTFNAAETAGLALIACGGYGRSELHPNSDIDIMILLNSPANTDQRQKISALVQFLWDTGLDLGHSVRTLNECLAAAQDDITVITNLIESRPIAGDPALFPALHQQLTTTHLWSAKDFFKAKTKEQKHRHHRFHDTGYNLEPNVKESPGGLRDIQTVVWIAKRHFGVTSLEELVTHQFATADECTALITHRQFLWRVRCHLHDLTDRKEDRLTFDHQRTIAEQMGYRDEDNKKST
jgi:[protein-PII] uridylyltransferase